VCHAHDSEPPHLPADLALPRIAGAAAAEPLELQSADGGRFSAALAESPDPAGPAVVLLPDVRGLHPFYIRLAERFADAGHHAVAIDYFGRTAGLGPRDEAFEYMPHVEQTRPETIQLDARTALVALQERTGAIGAVSVGFCFGGAQSFLAGTAPALGLDAVVGFYGALASPRLGPAAPLHHAEEIRCPVLGLFGGADQGIPVEQVKEFESRLQAAGVPQEIVIYPDAPHSFFDRRFEEHADACEDAWRRVLRFIRAAGTPD
jgi:carboxymethylenebutenolidase